ncbi:bis(5'-nucleosyl)-tetraphosphatase PrpE [Aeribacillus alveayuensis]|uniref:Bis(5'-nucleosyl)-tetraphosphatase PrpE [asymmetrical] n=1 Tax=Aeribacillus alveayuensis TaxID=279215 RepID=A0ABT9VNA2_9BACI|nr:protein phosphatase [Bacillus alveayuensis]
MKYDIIGDIHGCFVEFLQLTKKLGYHWRNKTLEHPDGRKLVFVGDLTDRGPNSLKVIETVYQIVKQHKGIYVPGNHCNKLYRFFRGNPVQIAHGLETTVAEYESLHDEQQRLIRGMFMELYEQAPLYAILDNGQLVVAHAGLKEEYIGRKDKKVKTFVLYGDITGKKNADGTPERRDWAKEYKGKAFIVYGHTPVKKPRFIHNTVNIDTGCVFGNCLTALRYPEKETISVPSTMPYVPEKFRAFHDED